MDPAAQFEDVLFRLLSDAEIGTHRQKQTTHISLI